MTPRTFAAASVNCVKLIDDEACGPSLCRVSVSFGARRGGQPPRLLWILGRGWCSGGGWGGGGAATRPAFRRRRRGAAAGWLYGARQRTHEADATDNYPVPP